MVSKELTRVVDLVLNGPGMTEVFKLNVPISRRQLLLLCMLVENGINPAKEKAEELAVLLSKEAQTELLQLLPEMLKKGGPGLPEFYDRLKNL